MTEVVERQKDASARESHGHQELSRVKKSTSLLPPKQVLGIYIQVPFCQTKCTYCNFHTGVASPAAYAPYASAVEREIRDWRALHSAAGLESVNRLPLGNADPMSLSFRAQPGSSVHAVFAWTGVE